jgi:hypothetical protein
LILSGLLPLLLRHGLAGFADPSIPVLSIPFVVMFLTLVGVRAAFAIPVEPKANWVVRLMEPRDRVGAVDGVRDAMLLAVVLPAALAAFVSAAFLWGLWPGVVHGTVSLLLGWSLAEVLLLKLQKLPFTCTYFPGLSRLRLFWWAYLTAFTTYCYSTPILEQHIIERPVALATFSIVAIGGLAGLAWLRARELVELNGFKYHEEDPQAMFAGFQLSEGVAANRRIEPIDRTQGRAVRPASPVAKLLEQPDLNRVTRAAPPEPAIRARPT